MPDPSIGLLPIYPSFFYASSVRMTRSYIAVRHHQSRGRTTDRIDLLVRVVGEAFGARAPAAVVVDCRGKLIVTNDAGSQVRVGSSLMMFDGDAVSMAATATDPTPEKLAATEDRRRGRVVVKRGEGAPGRCGLWFGGWNQERHRFRAHRTQLRPPRPGPLSPREALQPLTSRSRIGAVDVRELSRTAGRSRGRCKSRDSPYAAEERSAKNRHQTSANAELRREPVADSMTLARVRNIA